MRTAHYVLNPRTPPQIARGLCALAIMTKVPRAGDVKTRLVPPLTYDEAAELNTSFLRDTAASIRAAAGDNAQCIGVYTPLGIEHTYSEILPLDFVLVPQRGDTFGERLYFAALDLFTCGFGSICLIDSDSPTIPAETFLRAVKLLQDAEDRVVLGPSDDGGYYLIGFKKLHGEMFDQIEWSTERVLGQTVRRAKEIGLKVKMLPRGYDVDDRAGLQRLCNELLGENSPLDSGIAPYTREFLSRIIKREGRARIWPA